MNSGGTTLWTENINMLISDIKHNMIDSPVPVNVCMDLDTLFATYYIHMHITDETSRINVEYNSVCYMQPDKFVIILYMYVTYIGTA